ncbi:hypothetical protein RP20_CCG014223 [Aedes albopictus]|nr:hypothetical protein RP20_CCG014223 [Aedes albopictus]
MASSLNRIFSKKFKSVELSGDEMDHQEDDFAGFSDSGSETETISERDSCGEEEWSSVKSGGVAPAVKGNGKLQRNPTRRPNPKISNRNALLARENRRRKKEHVESLEREVDELKESNGKIRKALRKKSKLVEQLTRERNYLKSVIANRTGIMAVLKSVQRTGLPMTSSGLSYVTGPMARRIGSSSDEGLGASPHSILTDEEDKFNPHNGTVHPEEDPFLASFLIESESFLPDLGLSGQEVSFEEEFSRLPDVDELLSTMAGSGERSSSSGEQVITTEHNYFEHSNHNSLESGSGAAAAAGVCVHIVPGGRVSVEFCASCALSSQRAWLEEAEER